jgi:3-methylcrotonyl-CoA carboxylase alpha subunit
MLRLDDVTVPAHVVEGAGLTVLLAGRPYGFAVVDPLAPPRAAPPGADHVLAPIPGRITSVLCRVGDVVTRGQPLIVLEAMKMEMTLTAAMDGTIAAVRCAVGDMVQERADLVDFAAEA